MSVFVSNNINRILKRLAATAAVSAIAVASQSFAAPESRAAELEGDVARVWNKVTLQAILDTQPSPTVAARQLAVVNTCMFDAWTYFDPVAMPTRETSWVR